MSIHEQPGMTMFPTKLTKKKSHHFKLGVVGKKNQGRFIPMDSRKIQHPFFPEKNLLDDFGYIGSLDVFLQLYQLCRVVSHRSWEVWHGAPWGQWLPFLPWRALLFKSLMLRKAGKPKKIWKTKGGKQVGACFWERSADLDIFVRTVEMASQTLEWN